MRTYLIARLFDFDTFLQGLIPKFLLIHLILSYLQNLARLLALVLSSTKKKAVKILNKKFLIIAGFFAAGFLFSFGSMASTPRNGNFELLEADNAFVADLVMEKEAYQMLKKITPSEDHCCKIYNSNNELVYMSRDQNDQRLNELKKRCDLIMKTDSSSYYLLGD